MHLKMKILTNNKNFPGSTELKTTLIKIVVNRGIVGDFLLTSWPQLNTKYAGAIVSR